MSMKKHLLVFAAINLVAVGLYAGPLKIVDVNFPQINCLFSPNCTVVVDDSTTPITFTGATGSGFLQTRTFRGLTNAPLSGLYSYAYRIDLRNIHSTSTNDYIDSLRVNSGPVVPFTYNGQNSNMVWVATAGGIGSVAPSSALQLGNNITFKFNPPIYAGASSANGQSSFFFGVISSHPPTNNIANVTGFQGSAPTIPLNPNLPDRSPAY